MNNPTPQMRGPGPVGLAMAPVAKVDGIVTPPRRPARGTGQPPSPPPAEGSRWSARSALMLGLVGMLLLVGGFGLWSVTSRIAGAVVASGQVEVEQHRQVVQHPEGGVVEEIAVREGQPVRAGDLLIRLADIQTLHLGEVCRHGRHQLGLLISLACSVKTAQTAFFENTLQLRH